MGLLERLKRPFTSNKVSIAKKSIGNFVVQDSNINNLVVCNGTSDLIKTMGDIQQYDAIQKIIADCMSAAKLTHPLRPHFAAKYNSELEKLVSTPETEDAFKIYPKKIKGTFLIDYKKYPHMDKAETPWEYAYRTQTKVELKTTAYQEYLGDIEDPFPNTTYSDGMITIIGAPAFPPAVDATIVSGDVSIPIRIRRKPCLEYGKMLFGTISDDCGFDITLTAYKNLEKTDFKIVKALGCDLSVQLQREKLIESIKNTERVCIMIGDSPLVDAKFNADELSADMFAAAPRIVEYLENLQTIESYTGCKFDLSIGDVYLYDYRTAYILASSLKDMWHRIKTDFDDDARCDYDKIPLDIAEDANSPTDKAIEGKVLSVSLQGQRFSAEKYTIIYQNARINNIESVVKGCKKKRKNILITFRPLPGHDFFYKYCKFEGIKLICD